MTINISLSNLANLQNENTAVTLINQNSETIEGGFTTALNVTGDQMQGTLDMNSNQVINLPNPATANSPLRLQDLSNFTGSGTVTNIPPGGAIGDVLVKTSASSYITGWSPNAAGVTAGINIVLSGTSPVIISTNTSPSFNAVTSITSNITTANITTANVASLSVSTVTVNSNLTATGTVSTATLVVSGNANVGTVTTGTWSGTAITATSLAGTTLANNILVSSLTSIGNITSLTASTASISTSVFITSVTTPDASVWSATGITGVSGALFSFTGTLFNVFSNPPAAAGFLVNSFQTNGSINYQTASGTVASPSTLGAGAAIGAFGFVGYNGSSYNNQARIVGTSAETGSWTGTSRGAYIEFDTTASGSVSRTQAMRAMAGVIVGAGTVDPGSNNLVVGGNITATGNISGVTGNLTTITSSGVISSSGKITALTGGTTVAGGNATAGLALGTLGIGIYFGSGTPSITAATGSLYLRTDGTSLTGRMYINTTGASTWTAVSTVG